MDNWLLWRSQPVHKRLVHLPREAEVCAGQQKLAKVWVDYLATGLIAI